MREINIIDYILVIARHKKMIIRSVGLVTLVSTILLLTIVPLWYKSVAVVMPPKQQNPLGMLGSLSKATSSLRSLGIGAPPDELANLQAILTSQRVMGAIVNRFDLQELYGSSTFEKAVAELQSHTEIAISQEGVSIEIKVFDTDRQRATDLANAFIEMLNEVFIDLSVSEAKANREFLEKRFVENKNDLQSAEIELREFQEKEGVYSVTDQLKSAVEVASMISAQIALKEVQLGVLKSNATASNVLRIQFERELTALKKQLASMKDGSENDSHAIFPPFARAPEIGLEYLRKFREVEIQTKLLELLYPLYEQARIEEQRNTPSVLVLDRPFPASRHSKPKRMIILLAIILGTFLIVVLVSFGREYFTGKKGSLTESDKAKFQFIRDAFNPKNLFK